MQPAVLKFPPEFLWTTSVRSQCITLRSWLFRTDRLPTYRVLAALITGFRLTSVFSAAYGISFDDELPAKTGACENTKGSDELRKSCSQTGACRAVAADPSKVERCRSRSLRVRFICYDPASRSTVLSKLLDWPSRTSGGSRRQGSVTVSHLPELVYPYGNWLVESASDLLWVAYLTQTLPTFFRLILRSFSHECFFRFPMVGSVTKPSLACCVRQWLASHWKWLCKRLRGHLGESVTLFTNTEKNGTESTEP